MTVARGDGGLSAAPVVWIQVGFSSDFVRGGAVHRVTRWGEELVVYRAGSGRLVVHRATCPHLGAHLGGGTVRGECLECPFHGWQFNPQGKVHYVPGARRMPGRARLDTFPTKELGGIAFMFPREIGDGCAPPELAPTLIAELERSDLRRSYWRTTVLANLAEVQENGADSAHDPVVHRSTFVSAPPLQGSVHGNGAFATEGSMQLKVGGRLEFGVTFVDPCSTITRVTSFLYGSDVMSFGAQIGEKNVDLLFVIRTTRNGPLGRFVHRVTRRNLPKGFNEDRTIWEEKVWLDHPILSDFDGPLLAYRRWLEPFYSPHRMGAAAGVGIARAANTATNPDSRLRSVIDVNAGAAHDRS